MTKVMVFGTFDILHEGHIDFFKQAREHGDFLVAVVARDSTAKQIGKNPLNDENKRLKNIQKHVDLAVLGGTGDKYKVIQEHNPNVICLGYDQTHFVEGLKKLKVNFVRLKPFKEHLFKSSLIRNAMRN